MSSYRRPRPILKRNPSPTKQTTAPLPFSACGPLSPHVHFPPTPGLTSIHAVYSPQTYDRAPILVSPNVCALPDRHKRRVCSPPAEFEIEHTERRGRSPSRAHGGQNVKGSYFHPRAYEACELEPTSGTPSSALKLPPLVHDSSPSEDEDEIITPPDHYLSPSAQWKAKGGNSEDSPILSDVYVTPVYTVRSTRMDGNPWEMTPDGKRRRPELKRMAKQPSVKRVKEFAPQFSPHLDEGCLGGF